MRGWIVADEHHGEAGRLAARREFGNVAPALGEDFFGDFGSFDELHGVRLF